MTKKERYRIPLNRLVNPPTRVGITNDTRFLSIGQLAILLWHLYITTNEPAVGYLDAHRDLNSFVKNILGQRVKIRKRDLEQLLWAVNTANELGYYYHPNNVEASKFIKDFLSHDEAYNFKWNFIYDKPRRKRIRRKV